MGAVTELGATIAAVREIWHLAGNKHVINSEKRVSHEVAEKVKHVYHEVKEHFNHHDK